MYSTAFVTLFATMVLLNRVSGHLFQRAIPHVLTKYVKLPKDYKRQVECVNDKFDAAFQRSNSSSVSDCKSSTLEDIDSEINFTNDTSRFQLQIFHTLCIPECGNVFLDVLSQCGYFEEFSGFKDLLIGLCGTNQNGDNCYQMLHGNTIDVMDSCYESYLASDVCNCRSELLEGVRKQGCCFNVYHDFLAGIGNFVKLDKFYDVCDVHLPTGCNNSPIGIGLMPQVVVAILISVLIFSGLCCACLKCSSYTQRHKRWVKQ